MLTAEQLDALTDPILDLYERYTQSVINDIARRLAGLEYARPTAAWQMQRLTESGKVYENALEELSRLTGKTDAVLREMFDKAGVKALRFDDSIYQAAGLNPLPLNLSPAMAQVLSAGLKKTQGVAQNLTMTTAASGQQAFIDAADLAYMQISTGAFDYNSAIQQAVKQVASQGLSVVNFVSGRQDQLDVAMRRTVLTGVNQTVGNLQIARADEMGCDLVETSAHVGARNHGTGPANHESWQGRVFSRSGKSTKYPSFIEITGYGTGAGLCGWNCRHSFYPWFEGISENAYSQTELDSYANKTVQYNGEEMSVYDAKQQQRAIERKIRYWKRQEGALKAAGQDASAETEKVKAWQAKMREFIGQMNESLETGGVKWKWQRQPERERIVIASQVKVDKDLELAQQGKLFSLQSKEDDVIYSKRIDLSRLYGNDQVQTDNVILAGKQKRYIRREHPSDRDWLEKNQDLVLKAISNPLYMSTEPRLTEENILRVAHILYTGEQEFPFLNVVISFPEDHTESAKIWTMYRAKKRYLYLDDGTLKPQWQKVK
jgi:hypothetical protein